MRELKLEDRRIAGPKFHSDKMCSIAPENGTKVMRVMACHSRSSLFTRGIHGSPFSTPQGHLATLSGKVFKYTDGLKV